jgi:hypothetical protein
MTHKKALETLKRSLEDLKRNGQLLVELSFYCLVIFDTLCQFIILPVNELKACLKSYLSCKDIYLKTNMRSITKLCIHLKFCKIIAGFGTGR